jgi:hypothetical protein
MVYWGRLPAEPRRLNAQALCFRFERLLPVPVESVHCVSTTLPGGETLFIGIEPERLQAYCAAQTGMGPGTWTLVPDQLPDHYTAGGITPDAVTRLNLLQGSFEPAPRRKLRRLTAAVMHCGFALAVILAVIGIERRADALRTHTAAVQSAERILLVEAFPGPALPSAHPELRLTAELRTCEQAAKSPAATATDVAAVLQQVWQSWPTALRLQADTVSASADRIVVRGTAATLADAEKLARACATVATPSASYRAEPLQAQSSDRGATFLLTMVRQTTAVHP